MDLIELHGTLATLWIVWFFVLFTGIAVWALRPARRQSFDAARQIPLRDAE
ncbi:cbb3-type cytochrome oxidase subunit 3 [Siccirubricoccus phaeus]|uniref:cbb3-type cytochrome oxidase subunit 3 n=1 Tax=Siccirubricoccus phaeus TaxID=2595053 RepID=UPI0011F35FB9|nr:cbb3-type cytochrome c oxidase subunit 3 [Siccirubricoccus phaeus]